MIVEVDAGLDVDACSIALEPAPTVVGVDAMLATGISFRCLDYWTRRGYLRTVDFRGGSGYRRGWPASEVDIAAMMRRLVSAGVTLARAHQIARAGGHLEVAAGVHITVDRPEVTPCTCAGKATPR